jgi:hypothetical protein
MIKVETRDYASWQRVLFWMSWLLLLVAGGFVGHGFSTVVSVIIAGYHDALDLTLLLISGTALLEILLIGVYTLTRFRHQDYPFKRLLLWLLVGMVGIPLTAVLGSLYAYLHLPI